MTHPRDLDSLERELFGAARVEAPKAVSRERTLVVLRRALEDAAAEQEAESSSPHERRARSTAALWRRRAARGAWVGAGVLAAAALGLLVVRAGRVEGPRIAPDPATVGVRAPERAQPEERRQAIEAQNDEHESAVRRGAPGASSASGPRTTAKPPSLGSEVALLERARTALANDDPSQALRTLDEYTRDLRGTALRDEATLLRIDALARSGQKSAAQRLARGFVDHHPDSPLADRARRLTGLGGPSTGQQSTGGGEP
jgi:hypothetical protein